MSIEIKPLDTFKVAILSSYIDIATGEPQMNLQVFECVSENEYHFITIENKPISKLIALKVTDENPITYWQDEISKCDQIYDEYLKKKHRLLSHFKNHIFRQNNYIDTIAIQNKSDKDVLNVDILNSEHSLIDGIEWTRLSNSAYNDPAFNNINECIKEIKSVTTLEIVLTFSCVNSLLLVPNLSYFNKVSNKEIDKIQLVKNPFCQPLSQLYSDRKAFLTKDNTLILPVIKANSVVTIQIIFSVI